MIIALVLVQIEELLHI